MIMATKETWSEKILHITLKIKEQYPELGKFLDEMPVTIPAKKISTITPKILQEYYNSLTELLNNYLIEQSCNNEVE